MGVAVKSATPTMSLERMIRSERDGVEDYKPEVDSQAGEDDNS